MSVYSDPIQVYPLVEQWSFTISSSGINGTRVFLQTTSTIAGATLQTLPNIGDYWDTDYKQVTCKSISISYVGDNDNCGKKYICYYDAQPYSQTTIVKDLTTNIDVSGELISWEPPAGGAVWYFDGANVTQPIFKSTALATIRQTRIVKNAQDFMALIMENVNHINNADFYGFPAETVLFTGANLSEFRNRVSQPRWRVELIFVVRTCTGDFTAGNDGWNYQLREDNGKWDRPRVNGEFLYQTASFDELQKGQYLGDDETLYQSLPSR